MSSFQKLRRGRLLLLVVVLAALAPCAGAAQEGGRWQPTEGESQGLSGDEETPEYMSSNPTGEGVPWQAYIEMAGNKLCCYFTFEVLYNSDETSLALARSSVPDNQKVSSVDELIKKLTREVKGIALVRNRKNPSIIHVIDDRLRGIDDYALEKRASIEFAGLLDSLARVELPKRFPTIGERQGGLHGDSVSDNVTKVRVKANNEKIRDILTDCVPLDVYFPILWRAETSTAGGKSKTSVQYYGPDVPKPGHHPGRFYKAVFWKEYAEAIAEKLDCYLTTEELEPRHVAAEVPMRWPSLKTKYVPRARLGNPPPASVEEFMEVLRRDLDEVRVFRDVGNPAVVHLVDEPLLKIDGYFMGHKVDLNYSGTLGGMLAALEAKYGDLGLVTKVRISVGTTTAPVDVVGDKVTRVRVAVNNKRVRDLLTTSVSLKGYRRVLWESHTALKDDAKYESWVRFSGPKPSPEKPLHEPAHEQGETQENTPAAGRRSVPPPPATVAATTMAGLGLLDELNEEFATRKKQDASIALDETMRWFPFGEFVNGRFGGVLHTTVPAAERRMAESAFQGPLREALLGEFRLMCVGHPSNRVEGLDLGGVGRLLIDPESTWKTVGGSDHKTTCYVESDDALSRELVQWKCMTWRDEEGGGRHLFRNDAVSCASPAELVQKVAADRSGFGLFLYNPNDEKLKSLLNRVKVLKVGKTQNGPFVEPKREPILQRDYALSEPVILYVHPRTPLLVSQFADFCISPAGAKIAEAHGLITPQQQQRYEGDSRLKDAKAGKGTVIIASDLAGGADVLKDLALEFVKAKAAVQLKFRTLADKDRAFAELRSGAIELLLVPEPPPGAPSGRMENDRTPADRRSAGPEEETADFAPQALGRVELGRMAVGIIVHPENPLESLPLDEAKAVFSGRIRNWPAAKGAGVPIHVVGLGRSDPITRLVKEALAPDAAEGPWKYTAHADTAKVILAVARDPAAIGFVDMSQLPPNEKSVRAVRITATERRTKAAEGTAGGPRASGPHESQGRASQPGDRGASESETREIAQLMPPRADALPEDYPLARTLTLYVSPKATQVAKDFAEFLTPEHCKEIIARYNLLPPLHAEAIKSAGRPHPNPLPKGEGTRLALADEPIPLLLDAPDAPQDQPEAKDKKTVAKAKPEAATSEQPEPADPMSDAKPVAASEPASKPAQKQPEASSLSDKEIVWIVCGVGGAVILAIGIGWLQAPNRKKPRRAP